MEQNSRPSSCLADVQTFCADTFTSSFSEPYSPCSSVRNFFCAACGMSWALTWPTTILVIAPSSSNWCSGQRVAV
jgi:hypothetical protein